jgi:hypothetical protein
MPLRGISFSLSRGEITIDQVAAWSPIQRRAYDEGAPLHLITGFVNMYQVTAVIAHVQPEIAIGINTLEGIQEFFRASPELLTQATTALVINIVGNEFVSLRFQRPAIEQNILEQVLDTLVGINTPLHMEETHNSTNAIINTLELTLPGEVNPHIFADFDKVL